jgi:hypothetical protein
MKLSLFCTALIFAAGTICTIIPMKTPEQQQPESNQSLDSFALQEILTYYAQHCREDGSLDPAYKSVEDGHPLQNIEMLLKLAHRYMYPQPQTSQDHSSTKESPVPDNSDSTDYPIGW